MHKEMAKKVVAGIVGAFVMATGTVASAKHFARNVAIGAGAAAVYHHHKKHQREKAMEQQQQQQQPVPQTAPAR